MILNIILIIIITTVLALIINTVENITKFRNGISFKSSLDLLDLPLVLIKNNNTEGYFLIDTGSDSSCIGNEGMNFLNITNKTSKGTVIGMEGKRVPVEEGEGTFTIKNKKYTQIFIIKDSLDDAFNILKDIYDIQIYGILGSKFLNDNNYVIDYKHQMLYKS